MNVFTIGFSQKSAKEFFRLLVENNIRKLIDIRLNNKSQLAGFANVKHLPYFLELHNIEYEYRSECAPTKELLNGYKDNSISWEEYIRIYNQLLLSRKVLESFSADDLADSVLLCSEPTADQCHRRLMAEYIANNFKGVNIKHL